MPNLRVHPPSELSGTYTISLPASKSMVNRYLILYHLPKLKLDSFDPTRLRYSESRDSNLLFQALNKPSSAVWFEDGATPARFYTAWSAAMGLDVEIQGTEGLKKRSMLPLTSALEEHGVTFTFLEKAGYLPFKMHSTLPLGSKFNVDRDISSQFLSALMLIAPQVSEHVEIHTQGKWSSQSYIRLTEKCMNTAGIQVIFQGNAIFIDSSKAQLPVNPKIEDDWSSAAWFYQLCALNPQSKFHFPHLTIPSFQEDAQLADYYLKLGVSTHIENGILIESGGTIDPNPHFDFNNNIDLAPAIICTCAALKIAATFTGYETLRNKESDRLKALKINLHQMGVELIESNKVLQLHYSSAELAESKEPIHIQTFHDHRICMSFALMTQSRIIEIDDSKCVEKSFPNFWNALQQCNFVLSHG